MDSFHSRQEKVFFVRPVREAVPVEERPYVIKRFRKYMIMCRLFGCFFIEGIWVSSLKNAKVRMIGVYTLCTAAWLLLSLSVSISIIGKLFLTSNITQSFTKSLLFIVNSIVMTRVTVNLGCMIRGSSRFLQFFRDSQDYEKFSGFVPFEDSEVRGLKQRFQAHKFAYVLALLVNYGLVIKVPVATLLQGAEEWWRLAAMFGSMFTSITVLFYDALAYIVLSYCSEVLAEYLRAEIRTLRRKDCRSRPHLQTSRRIEKVRLSVSTIKSLKRSINEIWHPALAAWSMGLILILCITLYAIATGDLQHPDVWMAIAYSVQTSISFADLAILSQALTDEAQNLKAATVRVDVMEITESCREQVQYLHDTIDPESMCLTCAGFFHLSKSLILSMAGSIITYAIILVQTGDQLADHVDVGSLVGAQV